MYIAALETTFEYADMHGEFKNILSCVYVATKVVHYKPLTVEL